MLSNSSGATSQALSLGKGSAAAGGLFQPASVDVSTQSAANLDSLSEIRVTTFARGEQTQWRMGRIEVSHKLLRHHTIH